MATARLDGFPIRDSSLMELAVHMAEAFDKLRGEKNLSRTLPRTLGLARVRIALFDRDVYLEDVRGT